MQYSFWDLYPYFFLFFFLLIISQLKLSEKKRSNICYIIFILFFSCRYEIGWDYQYYLFQFKQGFDYFQIQGYAPFSRLIFFIACELDFYPFIFISFSFIHLSLLKFFIEKISADCAESWLYYLLLPMFFMNDLSTIRQAAATECVAVSYLFLKENNLKKYAGMIFFAMMFHSSAICGLLLYFINRVELSKKNLWIMFIASFVFANIMPFIMSFFVHIPVFSKFFYYLENVEAHSFNLLQFVFYAINILVLWHYDKFKRYNEEYLKYAQFGNFGVVLYNLFSFEPTTAFRISSCYMLFWIILLPSISIVGKHPKNKIYVLPFAFCFFYLLNSYVSAYNNNAISTRAFFPYDFWWNHL